MAIPIYIKEAVEEIARLARSSPHVNQQSGVSVRMSIANLENVVSNAERRAIKNRERFIVPRVSDLGSAAASARGKLELTMSEDDGQEDKLIHRIIDEAVKNISTLHLDLRELRPIVEYFESGQSIEVGDSLREQDGARAHRQGAGPQETGRRTGLASSYPNSSGGEGRDAAAAAAAEFILEGLHVHNKLNKSPRTASAPTVAEGILRDSQSLQIVRSLCSGICNLESAARE